MNFFGKEPAGSTVYPPRNDPLISSGLRDLSPVVQRDKKPYFMQELFRETFHQTVQSNQQNPQVSQRVLPEVYPKPN